MSKVTVFIAVVAYDQFSFGRESVEGLVSSAFCVSFFFLFPLLIKVFVCEFLQQSLYVFCESMWYCNRRSSVTYCLSFTLRKLSLVSVFSSPHSSWSVCNVYCSYSLPLVVCLQDSVQMILSMVSVKVYGLNFSTSSATSWSGYPFKSCWIVIWVNVAVFLMSG